MRSSFAEKMDNQKQVILYPVRDFLAVTTIFILNEMWLLRRRGWFLRILSLEREETRVMHARAQELEGCVLYAGRPFAPAVLKAQIYFLLKFPDRYIRLFFYVFFFRFFPYHLSELRLFMKAVHLAWCVRDQEVLHIHAHFAGGNTTCAMIIAGLLKKDFSFIAHAIDLFVMEKARTLRDKIREAKFVLTVSAYHRRFMIEKTKTKYPEKILVCKGGVLVDDFPLRTYEKRDRPVVLTVSRFVEKKGLFHLLEAYKILQEEQERFQGLIIGQGPLAALLEERLKEYGLDESVRLLSFQGQEEIRDHYKEADVFVLPCIRAANGDQDGMPYVLVEAMACGLPVVSTYLSGIPELVRDGETGFLVEPGDSRALARVLRTLLRDDALRKKVGLAAREHILKKHDLNRNIELLESLIRTRRAQETASS